MAQYCYAKALERRGDLAGAAQHFTAAVRTLPRLRRSPSPPRHRSEATGQAAEARRELEQALHSGLSDAEAARADGNWPPSRSSRAAPASLPPAPAAGFQSSTVPTPIQAVPVPAGPADAGYRLSTDTARPRRPARRERGNPVAAPANCGYQIGTISALGRHPARRERGKRRKHPHQSGSRVAGASQRWYRLSTITAPLAASPPAATAEYATNTPRQLSFSRAASELRVPIRYDERAFAPSCPSRPRNTPQTPRGNCSRAPHQRIAGSNSVL